jgi:hypothetical protein
MAVVDKDVDSLELCDIAVALELLPHLGANGRDGHVQGVHGLDLGCLELCAARQPGIPVAHSSQLSSSSSSTLLFRQFRGVRTARSQSRYDLSTRCPASSQLAASKLVSFVASVRVGDSLRTLARSLRKVCRVDHDCCAWPALRCLRYLVLEALALCCWTPDVGGGMSRGGQQVGESAADPPTFRRHMLAQHK